VTTKADVDVRWVDEPPPRRSPVNTRKHTLIAEVLRSRPGRWALVPEVGINLASAVNGGGMATYRPAGTFEAVVRQGQMYMRYIGAPARKRRTR